jgi:hypothetical protein
MADTVLVLPRRRGASFTSKDEGGEDLRAMWLDATLSESETVAVEWTEHPIESGAVITDHAVVRAPELTLEGVITRSPLWMSAEADNIDPSHLDSQLDQLRGMLADREPITIVTGLRSYEDYRIRELTVSRTPEDGQSVRVSVTLAPVQIVEAGTVLLPPLPVKPAKKNDAAKDGDQGTQSPTDASDARSRSVLKAGFDFSGLSALSGF